MATTYRDAGVDIDAMNAGVSAIKSHVRTTFTPGVLSDVGSFGGLFALDWAKYKEPVLVSSIDGVGTKLKVAILAGKHDTVGIDLVSHCVNDILVQGARPLFFLDYYGTGRLAPKILEEVVKGLAEGCRAVGCALLGGETAELPGVYPDNEYDLAGCIVGVVERAKIVDGSTVAAGDAVIGLASTGLHTNGYSLARRVLFDIGGLSVESRPDELGGPTVGDALLAPHRCYANSVLPLLGEFSVRGMAHLTGGGFYDNIPRVLPDGCSVTVQRESWKAPAIFPLIQALGNVPDAEMYRTFNMGIGYVMIVPRDQAADLVSRLNLAGEHAYVIGEVERGERTVTIR